MRPEMFGGYHSEEPAEEKEVSLESTDHAEEIAGQGNYEAIRKELVEARLLEKHTRLMIDQHSKHLAERDFFPTQEDWEMLAILHLYDMPTFEHSMRTFDIAHDMVTKTLRGPHNEDIRLQIFIQHEGVSLEQFLRAALFHDIGKVVIPREVLNNTFSDSDMNSILLRMVRDGRAQEVFDTIGGEHGEDFEDEDILARMNAAGYRAIDLVPIHEAFPQEQYPELIEIIRQRGFSTEQTLKSILQKHESESARILSDDEVVADLVGHHHNYSHERSNRRISIETLQMSARIDAFALIHLLAIADETDALRSARSYKDSFSDLDILATLIQDAETGHLNKAIVYLWVSNKYPEYQVQKNPANLQGSSLDTEKVRIIESFLSESKEAIDTYKRSSAQSPTFLSSSGSLVYG